MQNLNIGNSSFGMKVEFAAEQMSLERYHNLMESLFIESDPKYLERLLESKAQADRGEVVEKSFEDLDILAGPEG